MRVQTGHSLTSKVLQIYTVSANGQRTTHEYTRRVSEANSLEIFLVTELIIDVDYFSISSGSAFDSSGIHFGLVVRLCFFS